MNWLVLLLVIYAAIVVILLLLEDTMLYPATSAAADWYRPSGIPVEDVELTSSDGTRIHAWWLPGKGDGALLYCHGNGGNLSHRAHTLRNLSLRLNTSVLIFDYPGYGKSEGSPSEAGCYAAADAAYDWLVEQKKVRPAEIILFGKSLGGGVATELATRREHRALVLVKSFTSAPDAAQRVVPIIPTRLLMRNRFDTISKLPRCPRPIFLAHGTVDVTIPMSHSERLFEVAPEPKEFVKMEGIEHNDTVLTDEALDALDSFLKRHAPLPSAPRPSEPRP